MPILESILEICKYEGDKTVTDFEAQRYKNLIRQTFPKIEINRVEKLNNEYLYAAFQLKKAESKNHTIFEMIHSTAAENVTSIEQNNLDWRLVRRSKYGKGVSFTLDADYANYHSSWSGGSTRAYIICDVLIGGRQISETCNSVPDFNNDTLYSANGYVYVKFDDFSFYPKYALYYERPSKYISKYNR